MQKLEFDFQERAYIEFKESCKSQATLKSYTESLIRFMKHMGYTSFSQLAKTRPSKIKTDFAQYFSYLRDRFDKGEIRSNYFRPNINSIELFLIQNDVEVDLRKFKKRIPASQKISGDKPYSTSEIQQMLKLSDLRGEALVLFLSSSGIRGGAIWDMGNYLKFKHILKFNDGCARVTIYPDSSDEYQAFLTPEAVQAFDRYRKFRMANGETLTSESPLFRNTFTRKQAARTVKPLSKPSVDAILRRLAERIGVRVKSNSPFKRHEQRTEYGFRIRWNTIMKNHEPPLNINKIEKMFSHHNKNLPLDSSYNKPEDQVLHEEYDKAKLALTINQVEQQNILLKQQQEKLTKMQVLERKIEKLEWINQIKSYYLQNGKMPTIETKDGKKSVRYGQLVEEYKQEE